MLKRGLQRRYMLVLATLILSVVLVLASTLLHSFRVAMNNASSASAAALGSAMHEQLRSDGLRLTHLLASNLVNPVYQYDMETIHQLLRNVKRQPDVVYTYVFDSDGHIVHDGVEHIPEFGRPMPDPLAEQAIRAEQPLLQEAADVLDVTVPLYIDSTRVGGVRVGFSLEPLKTELSHLQAKVERIGEAHHNRQLVAILVITAVLLIVGLLTAALVTRGLVRPIGSLAQAATRVGAGQAMGPLDIQRKDELGELAQSFVGMEESLRRTTISRDYLDRLIASMNDALIVCDGAGNITMVNRAAGHMLGYGEDELVGRHVETVFEGGQCRFPDVVEVPREEQDGHLQCELVHRCGKRIPVTLSVAAMENNGNGRSLVYVAQDISERLRREEELRLTSVVYQASTEGVVITDADGRVLQINPAFTRLTGYTRERILGRHLGVMSVATSNGRQSIEQLLATALDGGRHEGEVWFERGAKEPVPTWLNLTVVRDASGNLQHFAGVLTDLSQLRKAERRIHHLAYYDSLTGLPNRLLFQDRLEQALHQTERSNSRLGVLYMDLDRFKNINDTKGHKVGDDLLKVVAKRISKLLRGEDTFARLGGDEFALILPGLGCEDDAAVVARKIIDTFNKPFQVGAYQLFSTTSIGISVFPLDASDAESLLKNADAAMYRAKEQGRNTYQFFTPDLNARVMEHMAMEEGLRQALERDELYLHYQPQIDLRNDRLIGVEALLRWNHPERGPIPPAKFIPVAEDTGLIVPVGAKVLQMACRQAQQWVDQGLPRLRMAVNLSPRQFRDPNLAKVVKTALRETGLDPALLEVEITESLLMEELDYSVAVLMQFHEMGLRISIDDFGTGYSSLYYLKRFPINTLKIDKTFVRDVNDDQDDASITRAIITMGHSLGIRTVAEGVENPAQEAFLRKNGCDYAQGYYYSRPLPAAECAKWLRARSECVVEG